MELRFFIADLLLRKRVPFLTATWNPETGGPENLGSIRDRLHHCCRQGFESGDVFGHGIEGIDRVDADDYGCHRQ